jgi:hypothetical protein
MIANITDVKELIKTVTLSPYKFRNRSSEYYVQHALIYIQYAIIERAHLSLKMSSFKCLEIDMKRVPAKIIDEVRNTLQNRGFIAEHIKEPRNYHFTARNYLKISGW